MIILSYYVYTIFKPSRAYLFQDFASIFKSKPNRNAVGECEAQHACSKELVHGYWHADEIPLPNYLIENLQYYILYNIMFYLLNSLKLKYV